MSAITRIEFCNAVLAMLAEPDWNPGILDEIAALAHAKGLAVMDDDGLFQPVEPLSTEGLVVWGKRSA